MALLCSKSFSGHPFLIGKAQVPTMHFRELSSPLLFTYMACLLLLLSLSSNHRDILAAPHIRQALSQPRAFALTLSSYSALSLELYLANSLIFIACLCPNVLSHKGLFRTTYLKWKILPYPSISKSLDLALICSKQLSPSNTLYNLLIFLFLLFLICHIPCQNISSNRTRMFMYPKHTHMFIKY